VGGSGNIFDGNISYQIEKDLDINVGFLAY